MPDTTFNHPRLTVADSQFRVEVRLRPARRRPTAANQHLDIDTADPSAPEQLSRDGLDFRLVAVDQRNAFGQTSSRRYPVPCPRRANGTPSAPNSSANPSHTDAEGSRRSVAARPDLLRPRARRGAQAIFVTAVSDLGCGLGYYK